MEVIMKNQNTFKKMSLVTAGLLSLVNVANAAVDVHAFTPAVNPSYMVTEDALLSSSWGRNSIENKMFFSAYYDWVNDPIVELNAEKTKRTSTLVEGMNTFNLGLGYGLSSRTQLGASTMMSLTQVQDKAQQFGMGDSRVFLKYRLNGENATVPFAIMPELFIPTGNRELFLSNGSVGGGIKLIAERDFRVVQVSANIGYRYFQNATFRDLNRKNQLPMSIGALIPVSSRWAFNTEFSGDISIPYDRYQNPSAFYGGVRYRLRDVAFTVGGAVGSTNNYSSADYRIIVGLNLMPQPKAVDVSQPRFTPIVKQEPAVAPVVKVSAVQKTEPRVKFTAKELIISEEVKFKHNKAVLTDSGANLLDEVAQVLKDNKASFKKIVIEGHTNELGSRKHNQKLSEQRAAAVREYLVSRGISVKALKPVGFGKDKPKFKKGTKGMSEEARLAANRRVAFKVVQ
jgi:outer membrane protein OmpA-like peptidoglycan-associated protein